MNHYRLILGGRLIAIGTFLDMALLLPEGARLLVGSGVQQKPNEYRFTLGCGKSEALIQKISRKELSVPLL